MRNSTVFYIPSMILWLLSGSVNSDAGQEYLHPNQSSQRRRLLKKKHVNISDAQNTKRYMQKAVTSVVAKKNIKTNPPTVAPTSRFYGWIQQQKEGVVHDNNGDNSSVIWNMSILGKPNGITIIQDTEHSNSMPSEGLTGPVMTPEEKLSVHQAIIQYLCDHTDYQIVHMTRMDNEETTFWNDCTSSIIQDINNDLPSGTVLVTDFQNRFGLVQTTDESVFYTHGNDNQVLYIRWVVWAIQFPILQLSIPDTVTNVQNHLKTILTAWMKDAPSSISNILAISGVGSEVQTFSQSVNILYSNDENLIINGDGVKATDTVFWHGSRIAGLALAGFLIILFGSFWAYSRNQKMKEYTTHMENSKEESYVFDDNAINQDYEADTRRKQKKWKRMDEYEEWVSIQINPKVPRFE